MDELEAGLGLDAVSPGHANPGPALPYCGTLRRHEVRRGPAEILLRGVNGCLMLLLLVGIVGSTYSCLKEGDS